MPICRQCDKLIKPLGMPVGILERMEVELRQIVSDVNYRFSDTPNYPVPAIPAVVEYMRVRTDDGVEGMSIVLWEAPCTLTKIWTCHDPRGG